MSQSMKEIYKIMDFMNYHHDYTKRPAVKKKKDKHKWYRIQVLDSEKIPFDQCGLCSGYIEDGDYCYELLGDGPENIVHEECAIRLTKDIIRNGLEL